MKKWDSLCGSVQWDNHVPNQRQESFTDFSPDVEKTNV